MPNKIEFDYDNWDKSKDKMLERPGNMLGYTAIICSLEVGDMQTVRARQRNQLIRETEAGVIGLIAGGLEWLRKRGLSAAEVQNKVKVYKTNNQSTADQVVLRQMDVRKAVNEYSNPTQKKLRDTIVIG